MGNKKNKKEIEKMNNQKIKFSSKDKKKLTILIIVAIILTIIFEVVFVKLEKVYVKVSVARMITIFGIIVFIGLHFVLGFKKLYDYIVKNRFALSGLLLILSTVIGYFENSFTLKEWLLNTDTVLSLWWNIKFYGLILVSYELFRLLTNDKQSYSIVGTIAIVFSGAVQYNFDKIDSLIIGELVTVLIYKFIVEEKFYKKVIISILSFASFIAYMFTFEGYAITFGYVFVALIIWIIIKNRDLLKNKKTLILGIFTLVISVIMSLLVKIYIAPHYNENIENESRGISVLFSYLYNMFLPFYNITDKELFGSFISIFPLPMLFSLYYIYKNDDNKIEFLLPMVIVCVLETVCCMSGFPETIEKISLLSYASLSRIVAAVSLCNLYMVFYLISNLNEKVFKFKVNMNVCIILAMLLVFIGYPEVFATARYKTVFACEIVLLSFLFLNFEEKDYKKVLLFFITLFTLIGGITVNPIVKGEYYYIEDSAEETSEEIVEIVDTNQVE